MTTTPYSSYNTRLIQDGEAFVELLAVFAVIAVLVWIAWECHKIRLLHEEDQHQVDQVKEALLKAHDELFSPNNCTCNYNDDNNNADLEEPSLYKSAYCAICHRSLLSTSITSQRKKKTSKPYLSESSPLMEDSKRPILPRLLSLRCGHEFHNECITTRMAAQRHDCNPCRCPVCLQAL